MSTPSRTTRSSRWRCATAPFGAEGQFLTATALNVARTDRQVRALINGYRASRYSCSGACDCRLRPSPPGRSDAVPRPRLEALRRRRLPRPPLPAAVHHMDPIRIGQGQLVGQLTCSVGATVIDDQDVHRRARRSCTRSRINGQILALVVGGNDDQRALIGRPPSPSSFNSSSAVAIGCGRRRRRRRTKPPIVQHPCGDSPNTETGQQGLHKRRPARGGRDV